MKHSIGGCWSPACLVLLVKWSRRRQLARSQLLSRRFVSASHQQIVKKVISYETFGGRLSIYCLGDNAAVHHLHTTAVGRNIASVHFVPMLKKQFYVN